MVISFRTINAIDTRMKNSRFSCATLSLIKRFTKLILFYRIGLFFFLRTPFLIIISIISLRRYLSWRMWCWDYYPSDSWYTSGMHRSVWQAECNEELGSGLGTNDYGNLAGSFDTCDRIIWKTHHLIVQVSAVMRCQYQ